MTVPGNYPELEESIKRHEQKPETAMSNSKEFVGETGDRDFIIISMIPITHSAG